MGVFPVCPCGHDVPYDSAENRACAALDAATLVVVKLEKAGWTPLRFTTELQLRLLQAYVQSTRSTLLRLGDQCLAEWDWLVKKGTWTQRRRARRVTGQVVSGLAQALYSGPTDVDDDDSLVPIVLSVLRGAGREDLAQFVESDVRGLRWR